MSVFFTVPWVTLMGRRVPEHWVGGSGRAFLFLKLLDSHVTCNPLCEKQLRALRLLTIIAAVFL